MANENLSTFSAPAEAKVLKRETTQQGELVSKRGKYIKIGGKIPYPYSTDAVMAGSRGLSEPTHARPMSGVEARISEQPKKGTFGNTWAAGNI